MPVGKRNKIFHQERKKPQSGNLWGFSSPNLKREGLTPQAGYRLFVTIQPFDDVVAGYTSRDSDNKRNKTIQKEHPLSLPVQGAVTKGVYHTLQNYGSKNWYEK